MPAPFLLDTNIYFLFFQYPKSPSYFHLTQKIQVGAEVSFYISEITSMEIHSVLGKYRRGSSAQNQQCEREITSATGNMKCSSTWISPKRKKMKSKVFRDIQKLISDIETQKGNVQATILQLDQASIANARKLLIKYADRYRFGSQDALIVGSVVMAREVKGVDLVLVTSDKGLKVVLKDEGVPFYDPAIP